MALSFAANLIFGARDKKVNSAFKRMGKNSERFAKRSVDSFRRASKAASSFKNITKGILAAGAIQKGVGLLSQGLKSVASDFLGFDNAVISAAAKFKGLDLTTQKGIETLEKLKKTAREVGKVTEFNAAQAAQGLDFLALAGFNAEQAMALLPGVTNLATVAQVDLATATDIASDSLGAFGLMTKDNEKLAKNFTRVQDVLAKTTASSNTNLTDLFEAIKGGAAAFTTAGQSMETFAALTGAMANSGLKGSKAGLVLKNMMNRLAKQSPKTAKMMQFLGIKIQDSNGNFLDATKIIDNFNDATKNLTQVQKKQAVAQIFGTEIQTGMTLLLNEGGDALRAYRQRLIDSAGAAAKMAKIMRSSLLNRLKSLGSAATEVGFQLFEAFSKQGAGAIDKLTIFIRKIDLTPFIETIKTVAKIAGDMFNKFTSFGESTGIFDAIRKSIDDFKPLLKEVFEFGKNIFSTFLDIAKESGIFDKVKEAISEIQPLFSTLFDVVKTVFNLLNDVGVFDALAIGAGIILDVVTGLAKTITEIWGILKPLIEAASKFFGESKSETGIIGFGGKKREESDKETRKEIIKQRKLNRERSAARKLKGTPSERLKLAFAKPARSARAQRNFDIIEKQRQIGRERLAVIKARGTPSAQTKQARTNPAQTQLDSKTTLDANIRLDIAGAPEGSTTTQKGRPSPQIQVNMLATQAS